MHITRDPTCVTVNDLPFCQVSPFSTIVSNTVLLQNMYIFQYVLYLILYYIVVVVYATIYLPLPIMLALLCCYSSQISQYYVNVWYHGEYVRIILIHRDFSTSIVKSLRVSVILTYLP
jgi:hypothetical protein